MKEGRSIGAEYSDDLLERIRDIRAPEKRFYQKTRDIYKLAIDTRDTSSCVILVIPPLRKPGSAIGIFKERCAGWKFRRRIQMDVVRIEEIITYSNPEAGP